MCQLGYAFPGNTVLIRVNQQGVITHILCVPIPGLDAAVDSRAGPSPRQGKGWERAEVENKPGF